MTPELAVYGADARRIQEIASTNPELREQLHSSLPYTGAEIVFAVRHEMARTLEDVLARRTRALFLNARAAVEMAPAVAALMAKEFPKDQTWVQDQIQKFEQLAAGFIVAEAG